MFKKLIPVFALASLTLAGCQTPPTGPSITADNKSIPSSGKIMGGTVQGAKVGPTTKVALSGSYDNSQGAKIDALGRPIQSDPVIIASVPVKEGKYSMDMPAVPTGAVKGGFSVVVYNDTNNNNQPDAGEDKAAGNSSQIVFAPVLGYNVFNGGAAQITDTLALDKVNVTFN